MSRIATWENLGTNVTNATTVDDVLNKAGLNYTVGTEKLETESGIIIPGKVATVRDDGHYYGVVSDSYSVVQNRDAFDFVNYMSGDVEFVKAGETSGGQVYIIGKMEDCTVLGDTFTPYVIFRNSFNGTTPVQAAICPLRVVCQNQFNYSFANTNNTINIKHSFRAPEKIVAAKEVVKETSSFIGDLTRKAEEYASIAVDNDATFRIIHELFPMNDGMTERQKQTIMNAKGDFMNAINHPDNSNFKGTLWGLVNAYTDFLTHREPLKNTTTAEQNKFLSVTFDPRAMINFMRIAQERAIA